ncbi:universal stress protein [Paraglaciecola sp. MB-3u-78]|uniref:universal stress protein n=1 Tax=Paraglaciecola sp. MB-3u-78 TaxID=2058332 RepID=UPI000C327D29|nr:universal stress protein [Paraglaciecola sp. MB-3u-78]PKG98163.1 universal stress protein [Paraglaciecola sp. MB-3u-78]
MSNYKNILVAIDVNAPHESIIRKALTVSQSPEDLILMYTLLPTTYIQPYLYPMEYNAIDDSERMSLTHKKLSDIATEFSITEHNVFVKIGVAADEIREMANEKNIDLIVIGTHGRSGIKLLLGSTANSVLHGVKQDVLAVRVHG